jgi:hypothetical protein
LERPELPDEVRAFRDVLTDAGFTLAQESFFAEHFGDCVIDLQRHGTAVRILRDRGIWGVDIGPTFDNLRPTFLWRAYLLGDVAEAAQRLESNMSVGAPKQSTADLASEMDAQFVEQIAGLIADDPDIAEGVRAFSRDLRARREWIRQNRP